MTHSRTFRVLFVGSMLTISLVTVAISGWLLWPEWRKYRAVENLFLAIQNGKYDEIQFAEGGAGNWKFHGSRCVEEVKRFRASEEAVPRLIKLLTNSDMSVRLRAIQALGEIGPQAKAALPQLIHNLSIEAEDDREVVAWAMVQIGCGPESEAAIPMLYEMMKHPVSKVPDNAIAAFAKIGEPAVPFLVEKLEAKDGQAETYLFVAMALGKIGGPAIPPLIEIITDPNKEDKVAAEQALEQIGLAGLPTLHKLLSHDDQEVRERAANIIQNIESEAAAWVKTK